MSLWIITSLFSAFFFSLKEILLKKFSNEKKINPIILTACQFIFSILIISIIFLNELDFTKLFYLGKEYYFYIFMSGVSMFLFLLIYTDTLEKHEVSQIAPTLNLSPIFLIFFGIIFLGEKISINQYLGVFLIIISAFIIEFSFHIHHKRKLKINHWNFLKSKKFKYYLQIFSFLFFASLAGLFIKLLTKKFNAFEILFLDSIILIILSIITLLSKKDIKEINEIKNPKLLFVSFVGSISDLLIYYSIALPYAFVSLVITIKRTSTLMTSLLGGLLFHENHLIKKILSIILMFIGLILIIN